jgi:hypothetical protein
MPRSVNARAKAACDPNPSFRSASTSSASRGRHDLPLTDAPEWQQLHQDHARADSPDPRPAPSRVAFAAASAAFVRALISSRSFCAMAA